MKHPRIPVHSLIILSFNATYSCWKEALNQKYLRRPIAFSGRRSYLNCMDDTFVLYVRCPEFDILTKSRCSEDSYLVSEFHMVKAKVKCTLVQALRLCRGRTAHRWSRGIALLFLDYDTRRGEGSASHPGRSLPQGKTRYPLYKRLSGPQGSSRYVRKIAPPPGFDHGPSARSQSLYRLRYPGH